MAGFIYSSLNARFKVMPSQFFYVNLACVASGYLSLWLSYGMMHTSPS
jgi:hypothetical protein